LRIIGGIIGVAIAAALFASAALVTVASAEYSCGDHRLVGLRG
jgi:hypothetical protein